MASGFLISGSDLDHLCEPIRGNNSANFGDGTGIFIGSSGDLNARYAAFPNGFGYAKYAWSPSTNPFPFTINGSPITPPSLLGHRPTFAKILDLTTTGLWYLWRNEEYVMLRNPSGTESSYHCSEFGLPIAPRIIGFELVGGGGGGGGGSGTKAAGGGGGGGFVAGWIDIPEGTTYGVGLRLFVGVAGTRGSGGTNSSGYGTKGGDTYIQNSSGTNLYIGYGGEPGKNTNDGAEYGVGGGTAVGGGKYFKNVAGARGGKDGGENGLSVSLSYSYRPEEMRSYSFAGGNAPASPGAGGASGAGVGGNAGGSGKGGYAPASGYGGGGGGGNYKWFDGFPGGYGAAGRIRLFY